MAKDKFGNRAKEDREQIRRDTEREAQVQPGPGTTTNEEDMRHAEGLSADPRVAEKERQSIETGKQQKGEGRIAD